MTGTRLQSIVNAANDEDFFSVKYFLAQSYNPYPLENV